MDNKPTLTSKGRYKLKYRGTECLNCSHPLDVSDKYCPNCSQINSTKKLSITDLFDEFFANIISYDSKLLKTLSALLLRPGRITADYVKGKRVSYTNPYRFLLSLAIIYFLMLSFSNDFTSLDRLGVTENDNASILLADEVIGDLSFNVGSSGEAEVAQNTLDSLQLSEKLTDQTNLRDSLILASPNTFYGTIKDNPSISERFQQKQDFFSTLIRKEKLYDFGAVHQKYGVEASFENRLAFNATKSFLRATQRPGSFISAMISKLPFVIFFFLPVFALFIWLMYVRKKYNYTDHLIFSFHNQSLLFILLIISFLIDAIFDVFSGWIFIFVFSFYLYKSMRRFYSEGRFKTIVKYTLLNTIFFILATFSVAILLAGSMLTY